MTDATPPRPLPSLTGLAGEFYAWCRKHELRFQRCTACGTWRHARSSAPTPSPTSGQGRVFTWTVAVRAMHPAFQRAVPYAAVVVEMDEGVRILSTVADCPPDALTIGMPVTVAFDEVTPEVTLPTFRRAAKGVSP